MLCFFSATGLKAGKEFRSRKPIKLTLSGTLHTGFYRSCKLSGLPRFCSDLINLFSEEGICAASLFNCQIPSSSDVIWCHVRVQKCDYNFTGPPCHILCPKSYCVCPSSSFCSWVKEWGRLKEWVFGTGRICPCSPSPRSLELWPGQAEMVSWRRLRFGGKLPGALIKLMPFVDSLCMNASIPACQRALSQSRKPNEYWLQGLY